jgi:hypothetical protein
MSQRHIDLENYPQCEYGRGECAKQSDVLVAISGDREGFFCHEHANHWADLVVALGSPDPREPS